MKAKTLVLSVGLITIALPAYSQTNPTTAGEVKQLQLLGQRFPDRLNQPGNAPPFLPQYETDSDDHGMIATYQPNGQTVTVDNPFFRSLGTNGRTCFTCHQPQNGWGLSSDSATQRFAANPNEPLFRLIDGATCPSDDVSTPKAAAQAYSLLTGKGLIRISLPMQASMDFQIIGIQDAYGNCNTNPITGLTGAKSGFVSFYRRPLPSTNLGYITGVMWDTREPSLFSQAIDATLGHAQATQAPPTPLQNQIVGFEKGVFTGQAVDNDAGDLTANGATGGPLFLFQNFGGYFLGMNDPFGKQFDPAIFSTYDAWAKFSGADPAQLALYRGEQVFNTVQFQISGVDGINDALGKQTITGSCGTCHNNPEVGNHSSNLTVDIGVTGASPPNLDVSGLPVFQVLCTAGPHVGQTFSVTDLGVAMVTGKCADIGKTKIPIIRGIAGRSPYFHNGSAPEITNLIEFYNQRFNIGFTDQQKSDLAVFLESL